MKNFFQTLAINSLYYVITLATLPFIIILAPVLIIYKWVVFLILQKLYKESDITHLIPSDAFWTAGKCHHNVADVLLILNLKHGDVDDLVNVAKQSIQEKILDNFEIYPKTKSTLENFMGYGYLKKADVSVDDTVTVLNIENKSENYEKSTSEIFSEYSNRPLPLNNKFLWELVFLKATSEWKKKNLLQENQVPILFRMHHIIGDGMALMNLFAKIFADNKIDLNESLNKFSKNISQMKTSIIIQVLFNLHLILVTPGFAIVEHLKRKHHLWNVPNIVHKRRLFWTVENNGDMIKNIKLIKHKVGHSFTEILLTVISASLGTYFKKVPERPEYTLIVIAVFGVLLIKLNNSNGNPELKNQFTFVSFDLPLVLKFKGLLDRVKAINAEVRKIQKSPQIWVNHFYINYVFGICPKPLIEGLTKFDKMSTLFSNLPGIPKTTVWNGHEIENIFFFPPYRGQLGIDFSALSYNNRLHLGLTADAALIPSEEECEKIVNRLWDNITSFKDEVEAKDV